MAASLFGPIPGAVAALLWVRASYTPLLSLGFRAPAHWPLAFAGGIVLGVLLKVGLEVVVMPLLGAPAENAAYSYLTGNARALPPILLRVLLQAAVAEEILYRGYLFERLGTALGRGWKAVAVTILASTSLFALAHAADQGGLGVMQAAVTGTVFGGVYAWRREIASVMICHAAFDLTAVALIYFGWEASLARLLID